ncbi:hypothetical protein [Vagococcus zengguangii]|uniref:hypothetical protein n=1 Tax=Vagococcus zengguangii TaxID=2571750 RepID=UPI00143D449C|nr:hypothetical protein [Vagococcus zengguangii]
MLDSVYQSFVASRIDESPVEDEVYDELFKFLFENIGCVYSHDTALYLHKLITEEPCHYSISESTTIASSSSTHAVPVEDIELVDTPLGNLVPVTNVYRTFLDCLSDDVLISESTLVEAWINLYNHKNFKLAELIKVSQRLNLNNELIDFIENIIGAINREASP